MKKIGIIDYFIDEWHSNEYLGLFKKANEELGLDYEIAYGYAEINKEGRLTTDEWCQKNGVIRCHTIEEVCEKSDNLLILAPANPETHLHYAEKALPYGKTTYIDKTFAPDLDTAKKIFALAEKYNTKIFTSSALRFAAEISDLSDVEGMIITGGGRSLEEYIIHQIEMAVKLMQAEADGVRVYYRGPQATIVVRFGERTATLNYSFSACGFSVDVKKWNGQSCIYRKIDSGSEFYGLVKTILQFFAKEEQPFDKKETLQVLGIRDAIIKGMQGNGAQEIAVEK